MTAYESMKWKIEDEEEEEEETGLSEKKRDRDFLCFFIIIYRKHHHTNGFASTSIYHLFIYLYADTYLIYIHVYNIVETLWSSLRWPIHKLIVGLSITSRSVYISPYTDISIYPYSHLSISKSPLNFLVHCLSAVSSPYPFSLFFSFLLFFFVVFFAFLVLLFLSEHGSSLKALSREDTSDYADDARGAINKKVNRLTRLLLLLHSRLDCGVPSLNLLKEELSFTTPPTHPFFLFSSYLFFSFLF